MKPTVRQIEELHFCEEMLDIEYVGNIEDKYEVSSFLYTYLDDAKNLYKELQCEYEAYINDIYD